MDDSDTTAPATAAEDTPATTEDETEDTPATAEDETEDTSEEMDLETEAGLPDDERVARQRARHRERRERARGMTRKGLLIVHTGPGKGKTSAAVGQLVRAWGQGLRVCMFQFIKAQNAKFGELKAVRQFGIEINPTGHGFTWMAPDLRRDQDAVRAGWLACRERILSGEYDLMVLDEFTYPLKYGWLSWDEVRETLDARPAGMHIVITGRYALPELIEHADTVTEMGDVKHHYRAGIRVQRGIEF